MNILTIKTLNRDNFIKYGTYSNMINPDTVKFGGEPVEFYRDMLQLPLGTAGAAASFSVCRVQQRDNILERLEYHNHTGEGILPLDGDVLLTLAPANNTAEPPEKDIEVFLVPEGTLVILRPGVWHGAPFATAAHVCVNVLIVLPERTYLNDCHRAELMEKQAIER